MKVLKKTSQCLHIQDSPKLPVYYSCSHVYLQLVVIVLQFSSLVRLHTILYHILYGKNEHQRHIGVAKENTHTAANKTVHKVACICGAH